MKKLNLIALISVFTVLMSCGVLNKKNKGKGVNLFTIEQDKQFGAQVAAEIDGNPAQYPLLDSIKYKSAYEYIYKVRDKILASDRVSLKDDFSWSN